MISLPWILAIVFLFLVYLVFKLRYGGSGRSVLFKIMASLQGMPSLVLNNNPNLCKKIMDSCENKGKGIEMFLSCPAFLPLYNSESVDGDQWKRLITMFRKIIHSLNFSERLPFIVKKHCLKICADSENIDSVAVQRLTARIFSELLLNKELDEADIQLCVDATMEWRKHIAQKNKSNYLIKEAFVNMMWDHLLKSDFDPEKFMSEHQATKNEVASSFFQPFIISPTINFPDIFCEISLFLEANPKYQGLLRDYCLGERQESNDGAFSISLPLAIVYESLRLRHSFPIIERELTKDVTDGKTFVRKGTHVYIELDNFIQDQTFRPENWQKPEYYKENSWILFATGPRMCAGRLIAIEILEGMLRELVKGKNGDFEKLKIYENHKFSGRTNDNKFEFGEMIYQVKTFGNLMKNLIVKKIFH